MDAYHKIIFLHNVTIPLSLLNHSHFVSVLSQFIATYDTHSFLLPYLSCYVFSVLPIGIALHDY